MPYKRKNQGRQFADNQGLEQIVWAPVRLAGNVQDAVNVARIAKVRLLGLEVDSEAVSG